MCNKDWIGQVFFIKKTKLNQTKPNQTLFDRIFIEKLNQTKLYEIYLIWFGWIDWGPNLKPYIGPQSQLKLKTDFCFEPVRHRFGFMLRARYVIVESDGRTFGSNIGRFQSQDSPMAQHNFWPRKITKKRKGECQGK